MDLSHILSYLVEENIYNFFVLKTRPKEFEVATAAPTGTPSLLEWCAHSKGIFSDP